MLQDAVGGRFVGEGVFPEVGVQVARRARVGPLPFPSGEPLALERGGEDHPQPRNLRVEQEIGVAQLVVEVVLLVVKADVQGSVEAVKQSLMKLSNEEVMIKVVHGGVGAINESDVILASASNAIIIGFNVRPDAMAKAAAEREKVDMRLYRVIYNAIEDIEAAIKGMLDPVYREKVIGHVEVRQIYKASGVGTIAGCYVLDGTITKDAQSRIVRDGIVIYEGELASLKRFKDDVKEVKAGFECGIVFEKYNDIKEGDQIEAFVMEEIPR